MANRLAASQREEIKKAFKLFDKNGDGSISVEELGAVVKELGLEISEEVVKLMIRAVDRNGNGKVEYGEFEDMMARQMGEPITPEGMKLYFKKFDQNGDGFITTDELDLAMRSRSSLGSVPDHFQNSPVQTLGSVPNGFM